MNPNYLFNICLFGIYENNNNNNRIKISSLSVDSSFYSFLLNEFALFLKILLVMFVRVVTDVRESRMIIHRIMSEEPCVVGFDMEGERFTCYDGQVTIIQLCDIHLNVYLFDVLTNKDLMTQGDLLKLLCSNHVKKIAHDCRLDSGALYKHYNTVLHNVFDTQMAHILINVRNGSDSWWDPTRASLKTLCCLYNVPLVVSLKDSVKYSMTQNDSFWSERPLTNRMINYAAADAAQLIPLYRKIFSLLSESDRDLMCQLSKEQIFTMIDGEWVRSIQTFRKGQELHEKLKQNPDLPLSKQQRKSLNRYRHLVSLPQSPLAQPTLR